MSNNDHVKPTANSGDQRRFDALRELDLPRYVLLPGDPDRIAKIAAQWDEAKVIDLPRGCCAASGTYKGVRIGAVATMLGAPSLDMILSDLARLGLDTFIRVGTCGTLKKDIAPGSLIINDASVRLDGMSHFYVRNEFPAAASHEVTFALVDAAREGSREYFVGTGATSGSFFVGQGRPGFNGYMSLEGERIYEEMDRAGVLNFEMETSGLFTLARLFGMRAGAVCSVVANRVSGEWVEDSRGIDDACIVAAETVRRLTQWDAAARERGDKYFSKATI